MATLHKLIGNVGYVRTSATLNAPANILFVAEFDTASGKQYSIVNWRPSFTDPTNNAVTVPAQWVINDKGWVLSKIASGDYSVAAGVVAKLASGTAIAPINSFSGLATDVFDNDTAYKSVIVYANDAPFSKLGSGVTTAYIQTVFGTQYMGTTGTTPDPETGSDPLQDPRSADLLTTATDFIKKNWLLILVVLVVLYFLYQEFFAKKKGKGRR